MSVRRDGARERGGEDCVSREVVDEKCGKAGEESSRVD